MLYEGGPFNPELSPIDFELGGIFTNLTIQTVAPNDEQNNHYFVTISGILNISEADWDAGHWQDKLGEIFIKDSAHNGTGDMRVIVKVGPEHGNGHHDPTFSVFVDEDRIIGFDWEPSVAISIKINGGGVGVIGSDESGFFIFDAPDAINVNDIVEVSDEITTKIYTVQYIEITNVDRETNDGVISGLSELGATIRVEVEEPGGPGAPENYFRGETTADGSGHWTINANIKIEDTYYVNAIISDGNDNSTVTSDIVVPSSSVGLIRVNNGKIGEYTIIDNIWYHDPAIAGDRGRIKVNSAFLPAHGVYDTITFAEFKTIIAADDDSNQTYHMFKSWNLSGDAVELGDEVLDADIIDAGYNLEVTAEDGTIRYYIIGISSVMD